MELAVETVDRIFYQTDQFEFSTSVAHFQHYAPHTHPGRFQLELVLSGETECGIGQQRFMLPQHYYSLVNPDVEHDNLTRGWKHALFLIFDRRIVDETASQLYRFITQPILFFDAVAPCSLGIQTLFHTLLQEVHEEDRLGRRLFVDSALLQLSVMLLRTLRGNHTSRAVATANASGHTTQIARAVELIRYQFHHDLSLNDLARVAGMSRYHFLRCFKAQMGETPYAYVMKTRLQAAARLLRSSSQAITEIALTCGFASLSHFGSVFRRMYHCSPSRYRHPGEEENATIRQDNARSC